MTVATNVIALPDSMVRAWEVFAEALRHKFAQYQVDPDDVEHALAALRPIYLKHARPARLPEGLPADEILSRLNDWATQLGAGLLFEIATREIELRIAGKRP